MVNSRRINEERWITHSSFNYLPAELFRGGPGDSRLTLALVKKRFHSFKVTLVQVIKWWKVIKGNHVWDCLQSKRVDVSSYQRRQKVERENVAKLLLLREYQWSVCRFGIFAVFIIGTQSERSLRAKQAPVWGLLINLFRSVNHTQCDIRKGTSSVWHTWGPKLSGSVVWNAKLLHINSHQYGFKMCFGAELFQKKNIDILICQFSSDKVWISKTLFDILLKGMKLVIQTC